VHIDRTCHKTQPPDSGCPSATPIPSNATRKLLLVSLPTTRMSTDAQRKAIAAGAQLQQALESAADALKIIASAIPTLFPQDTRMPLPFAPKGSAATVQPTSTPHKRKRKEKNPDAPDKPVSAYHLWSKENKDRIKASMPGVPSASEVVSEVNRLWKELADGVKKVSPFFLFLFFPSSSFLSWIPVNELAIPGNGR